MWSERSDSFWRRMRESEPHSLVTTDCCFGLLVCLLKRNMMRGLMMIITMMMMMMFSYIGWCCVFFGYTHSFLLDAAARFLLLPIFLLKYTALWENWVHTKRILHITLLHISSPVICVYCICIVCVLCMKYESYDNSKCRKSKERFVFLYIHFLNWVRETVQKCQSDDGETNQRNYHVHKSSG